MDNYTRLTQDNLNKLYTSLPENLDRCIQAQKNQDTFTLHAFGTTCIISPQGIHFDAPGKTAPPIPGLLVSLYALNATDTGISLTPFKAFKELPDSTPYAGAFATHTEQALTTHVPRIKANIPKIMNRLKGQAAPSGTGGDFAFVVYPLPKIALCYIFYEADEDFPAGVTCLYSKNARQFMPVDGLADVGEYTTRRIIDIIS